MSEVALQNTNEVDPGQAVDQMQSLAGRSHKGSAPSAPRVVGIQDVARAACVSPGTVSRVVNGVRNVKTELRLRVMAAMSELAYLPNTHASSLARRRSRLLGLIVADVRHSLCADLIMEFQHYAHSIGYETLVCFHHNVEGASSARRMKERQVEGVAVALLEADQILVKQLEALNLPTIALRTRSAPEGAGAVTIDYSTGMFQAVRYLAALGHRNICFLPSTLADRLATSQLHGFLGACQSLGLLAGPNTVMAPESTIAGGYEVVERLVATTQRPTAIVCSNVSTSHGLLQALTCYKNDVPRGLSLIACEDATSLMLTAPGVTAIGIKTRSLAEALVDQIVTLITNDESENRTRVVLTNLIVRSTTHPPF